MTNPMIGVQAHETGCVIFLDVTKIVYYTRATNKVRLVCGLVLTFDEDQMVRILGKLDDIHISNIASNTHNASIQR